MLFFPVILTLLNAIAFYTDATRYIIPNWLNGFILVLYIPFAFLAPELDWLSGIYAFLIVFICSYPLFYFNLVGGGDVKLLCVLALWCGLNQILLQFIVYTGLLGGLLSLLLLGIRPLAAWLGSKFERPLPIPKVLTYGQPIPYGLAITIAFLILLWNGSVPGIPASLYSSL